MGKEHNPELANEYGELTWGRENIPPDDAAHFFYHLADMYFEGNFGTALKSEVDLYMFEIFFSRIRRNTSEQAGSLVGEESIESSSDLFNAKEGWHYISDLEIAIQLGIPIARVANMREKIDIRSSSYDSTGWADVFLRCVSGCKPYLEGDKLNLLLPDRYSKRLLEDALMRAGYFFDYTLNNKALSLPVNTLFAIAVDCYYVIYSGEYISILDGKEEVKEFIRDKFNEKNSISDIFQSADQKNDAEVTPGHLISNLIFNSAQVAMKLPLISSFFPDINGLIPSLKLLSDSVIALFVSRKKK